MGASIELSTSLDCSGGCLLGDVVILNSLEDKNEEGMETPSPGLVAARCCDWIKSQRKQVKWKKWTGIEWDERSASPSGYAALWGKMSSWFWWSRGALSKVNSLLFWCKRDSAARTNSSVLNEEISSSSDFSIGGGIEICCWESEFSMNEISASGSVRDCGLYSTVLIIC